MRAVMRDAWACSAAWGLGRAGQAAGDDMGAEVGLHERSSVSRRVRRAVLDERRGSADGMRPDAVAALAAIRLERSYSLERRRSVRRMRPRFGATRNEPARRRTTPLAGCTPKVAMRQQRTRDHRRSQRASCSMRTRAPARSWSAVCARRRTTRDATRAGSRTRTQVLGADNQIIVVQNARPQGRSAVFRPRCVRVASLKCASDPRRERKGGNPA